MPSRFFPYVGDQLAGYVITNKDDDASPNFYGYTRADGAWYILKETVSAGNDTYEYAMGSSDFDTNWTNRVGLTYLAYHKMFTYTPQP